MSKKYNYIKNKTTLGVFFSGLFLIASTATTYAGTSSNSEQQNSVVDPIVTIVQSNDLGSMSMNFTESDISNAQTISSLAGSATGEYYMLIASYQVCILSNTLVPDSNDFAGVLLKVAKDSDANYYKAGAGGANPTTSGINQLVLYNSDTAKKVPYLIQISSAGYTKSDKAFGSDSAVANGNQYAGQYTSKSFIIGGDAANMATSSVFLHDANVSSLVSAVDHENLALDVYGSVNHYGLNSDLQSGDVSSASGAANGLVAGENHTLSGCTGDQDPTDTNGSTSMLITIKLYANAAEMALAPAGTYTAKYTIHYADINDIAASSVYDVDAVGS